MLIKKSKKELKKKKARLFIEEDNSLEYVNYFSLMKEILHSRIPYVKELLEKRRFNNYKRVVSLKNFLDVLWHKKFLFVCSANKNRQKRLR